MNKYLAMLSYVRTPSGATFKCVLQLEATFILVKRCISTKTRTQAFGITSALSTKLRRHEMDNMLLY